MLTMDLAMTKVPPCGTFASVPAGDATQNLATVTDRKRTTRPGGGTPWRGGTPLTIAVETGLVVPGATVLADKGLAGRDVEQQIAGLGVRLLRPDRRNEPRRHGSLGGVRQWIESVFDTLKGQLGLEHHGARTAHGVFTRVAQRLLALATAVWRNWAINAPTSAASSPTTTDPAQLQGKEFQHDATAHVAANSAVAPPQHREAVTAS
jgi:hypothetical protein